MIRKGPELLMFVLLGSCFGIHDGVPQNSRSANLRRRLGHNTIMNQDSPCSGGLCAGMKNGPHEGGSASYPTQTRAGTTSFYSTMTVPDYPKNLTDITYYIWTDVFFGDVGYGRMNQFVPQLLLGDVLAGSTGFPDYNPIWRFHDKWMFGSHYFFEIYDPVSGKNLAKAAYGEIYPAYVGETLFTNFTAYLDENNELKWLLTMGSLKDASRTSVLKVEQPYMGLGRNWPVPSVSWTERNYSRMYLNSCWELYGAIDRLHYPSSGSHYELLVHQPEPFAYPWAQWVMDEGQNRTCATSRIEESRSSQTQSIQWDIGMES